MKEFWILQAGVLLGSTTTFFWRLWSPPFMLRDVEGLVWVWFSTAMLMTPLIGLWLVIKKRYGLRW